MGRPIMEGHQKNGNRKFERAGECQREVECGGPDVKEEQKVINEKRMKEKYDEEIYDIK